MPDRFATIEESARAAAVRWRDLLALARGRGWWLPALAFLVGALDAERGNTVGLVVGILYFAAPFGLLCGGFDAIARSAGRPDHASDVERGDAPDGLPADAIRLAIAVTNVPLLVLLVLFGGPLGGAALAGAIAVAVARSWPPVRLLDRPWVDLVAVGSLVVLAAVAGLALDARAADDLPVLALAALLAWTVAVAAIAMLREPQDRLLLPERVGLRPRTADATAIGPRALCGVALAGFAAAVVLSLAHGGLGPLVAGGLAMFLLVPPGVLLSTPTEASHRGRRAAADTAGLTVLVGAWLGVVLLQHWGVTAWDPWTIAVVVPAGLAGYVLANTVATRLATRHRRVPAAITERLADVPSLTIVVPCQDAVARLPATLAALRAQTYADTTVLVVDDGSSDGSADEAGAWLGSDAVISAPPRPAGWTSRNWACQVGADAATTDLVLFLDDGTVLAPVAARILVEQLEAGRLDLLSGVARHAMPTPGERAGVPGFPLVLFGFVPIWWSALTRGRPAMVAFAHASLVLVRRSAYLAAGGHATAAEQADDAPGLARRIARAGGRVGTVHAARLGAMRRDRDVDDVVARWRRTFVVGVGDRLAPALALMVVEVLAFVVPLLLPPIALLSGVGRDLVAASLVPLAVLLVARLALAISQHHPLSTVAWHPVTVVVTLLGQAAAIADHVIGMGPDTIAPDRRAGGRSVRRAPDGSAVRRPDPPDQGQAGQQDPGRRTMVRARRGTRPTPQAAAAMTDARGDDIDERPSPDSA